MASELRIRPYEPRDRAALRKICCDTADAGQPVERFFPDREVIADLLMNYYTQFEPQSTWVVDKGDGVVGYLTGCLDTKRFMRVMTWRIGPWLFVKALFRGTFFRPQTLRLFRVNIGLWLTASHAVGPSLHEYPAHLHINLMDGFRGHGLGRDLVKTFCDYAVQAGARGVHARVSADNPRACHFFEQAGFIEIHREPRMRKPEESGSVVYTIVYGRSLD
ncbi:MAG TPA: GNAT family N-acetyltransferase [Verrucomicrobiae bacterium]|nr:GNAT family N-acetyltransferase [Verrucomicrobiae bacterium]